jgi:hypothetical protein
MRTMVPLLSLSGALAFVLQGCTNSPDAANLGVTYDTIAGIEHVTSVGSGAWAETHGAWTLHEAGAVEIGQLDGPDQYVFGQISGLVVDAERRIYVANPQTREIKVFSADGEFLRRIGRDGEGPGEFRNIDGLTLAPDGIAALDPILRRVTVFAPSGEMVRTFRLARSSMVMGGYASIGFDSRGRYFEDASLSRLPETDSVAVITYDANGTVTDTALLAVIPKDQVTIQGNFSFPRPFSPQPSLTFGPRGTVYLARGDEYRIDVLSPSGDSLRVIRREVEPRAVTAVERDSARALLAQVFQMYGLKVPAGVDLPKWKPVIDGLVVDSDGDLWVLMGQGPVSGRFEWSVHDPEGRYLGAVRTPVMTVTQVGEDYVAGTVRDSLGVAKAVVYPLTKRAP